MVRWGYSHLLGCCRKLVDGVYPNIPHFWVVYHPLTSTFDRNFQRNIQLLSRGEHVCLKTCCFEPQNFPPKWNKRTQNRIPPNIIQEILPRKKLMGCNLKKSPQLKRFEHHLNQTFPTFRLQLVIFSRVFWVGLVGLKFFGLNKKSRVHDQGSHQIPPDWRLGHGTMGHAGAVVDHALLGRFFFYIALALDVPERKWMDQCLGSVRLQPEDIPCRSRV